MVSGTSIYTTQRIMTHIIKHTVNWREEDYDGHNDYFVNPEYLPQHRYYKGYSKEEQEDEELNTIR